MKWKSNINIKDGFDLVIGNPPYVKARDNKNKFLRNYIEKHYKSAYKMWDLYVPFIEKSLSILNKNGLISLIIPDTIGVAEYAYKIIELIENNYNLKRINFFLIHSFLIMLL